MGVIITPLYLSKLFQNQVDFHHKNWNFLKICTPLLKSLFMGLCNQHILLVFRDLSQQKALLLHGLQTKGRTDEPEHDKNQQNDVRPAKTQISLGIHSV